MKRQGGFTLIELVVVIVILGILAVTAAPRFLNLQGDARQASLQGLKGAIDGLRALCMAERQFGRETSSSAVDVDGISTIFGYPRATPTGIGAAVVGLTTDWAVAASNADSITYGFSSNTSATCAVVYQQATSSAAPVTTVASTGC